MAFDPLLLSSALLIVAFAAIIQSTTGMGFGLVAAPALIWIYPEMIPATILIMGFVVSGISALRERKSILPRQLGVSVLGRLAGSVAAIPLLFLLSSSQAFTVVFGVLILLAVGLSLGGIRPGFTSSNLLIGGTVSGFTGTITSVGAPPIVLVFQDQPASSARPTLNAFFALASVVSLAALAYADRLSEEHLLLAVILAPGFLGGVFISKYLRGHVDGRLRPLVLIFCSGSAVGLIARGLV